MLGKCADMRRRYQRRVQRFSLSKESVAKQKAMRRATIEHETEAKERNKLKLLQIRLTLMWTVETSTISNTMSSANFQCHSTYEYSCQIQFELQFDISALTSRQRQSLITEIARNPHETSILFIS